MAWGIKKKDAGFVDSDGSVPPVVPVSNPLNGTRPMSETGHGSYAPVYTDKATFPFDNEGAARLYAERHIGSGFDIVDGGNKSDVVHDPAVSSDVLEFKEAERLGKAASAPRRATAAGVARVPVPGSTRAGTTQPADGRAEDGQNQSDSERDLNQTAQAKAKSAGEARSESKGTKGAEAKTAKVAAKATKATAKAEKSAARATAKASARGAKSRVAPKGRR